MKPSLRSGNFLQMIWIVLFGHPVVKRRVEDNNIYFFENYLVHQLRLKRFFFFSKWSGCDLGSGFCKEDRAARLFFENDRVHASVMVYCKRAVWCDSVANDLDCPNMTMNCKKDGLPPGLTYCKEKGQFFLQMILIFPLWPVVKRTIWYDGYLLQIIRNILQENSANQAFANESDHPSGLTCPVARRINFLLFRCQVYCRKAFVVFIL